MVCAAQAGQGDGASPKEENCPTEWPRACGRDASPSHRVCHRLEPELGEVRGVPRGCRPGAAAPRQPVWSKAALSCTCRPTTVRG